MDINGDVEASNKYRDNWGDISQVIVAGKTIHSKVFSPGLRFSS